MKRDGRGNKRRDLRRKGERWTDQGRERRWVGQGRWWCRARGREKMRTWRGEVRRFRDLEKLLRPPLYSLFLGRMFLHPSKVSMSNCWSSVLRRLQTFTGADGEYG